MALSVFNFLVTSDQVATKAPDILGVVKFLNERKDYLAPGLNFLVIAGLILLLSGPSPVKAAFPQSANAAAHFKTTWLTVWVIWALIYALQLAQSIIRVMNPSVTNTPWVGSFASVVLNLVNNGQTVVLLGCYATLLQPHYEAHTSTRYAMHRGAPLWPLGCVAVVALAVAQALCEGTPDPTAVRNVFSLVTYTCGGLALALLASRLESRYIAIPIWVTGLLYFYALLQPVFGVAEQTDIHNLATFIMVMALPLKLLLFAVVYWLLKTTRLQFYYEQTRLADLDLPATWQRFRSS